MPGTVITDPGCDVVSGNNSDVLVLQNREAVRANPATAQVWVAINGIKTYSRTPSTDDMDASRGRLSRSLPVRRGFAFEVEGERAFGDPGQAIVDAAAKRVECEALEVFRFLIPTPDPDDKVDEWYWASVTQSQQQGTETTPWTWGATFNCWTEPEDFEEAA